MFSTYAIQTANELWGPKWEETFSLRRQEAESSFQHYDAFQVFRHSFSQRQMKELPSTEESLCQLAAQGHWTAVTELAQKLEESMIMGSHLYSVSDALAPPSCFLHFPPELLRDTKSAAFTGEGHSSLENVANAELAFSTPLKSVASEVKEGVSGREDEFQEVMGNWLDEQLPAIRDFLQYVLSHPRLLLADPDLAVCHREWVNRLPFRTAQVQAWWKMKQYKRSVPLLSDFTEYTGKETLNTDGSGGNLEVQMGKERAVGAHSSSPFAQTFLHPTTHWNIIPFSLRYMNALLPFYLDPNSEESVKRLSALLQRSGGDEKCDEEDRNVTSDVEIEVTHLLHVAHVFIPSSSWYVHSRAHRPSTTLWETSSGVPGGVQRHAGESLFGNQSRNSKEVPTEHASHPLAPCSDTNSFTSAHLMGKGKEWRRQVAADSLYELLKAEAQWLVESRWVTRRQRLLSTLAFVRYSQRRVSVSLDAYRGWFKEEAMKWTIASTRVAGKSCVKKPSRKFVNSPKFLPIPRVLPLFHSSSGIYKSKSGNSTNLNHTIGEAMMDVTAASLLFALAPVIFILFHLLRQACFSLQLGNRYSAKEIQICIGQLAHYWEKLAKEQHDRRVTYLSQTMTAFNAAAGSCLARGEVGFSFASLQSLRNKVDLVLRTSRSLSVVFGNFLSLLQDLLEGFFAMSSERFEMGIHQFSGVAERAQEAVQQWMEEFASTTKLDRTREEGTEAEAKEKGAETVRKQHRRGETYSEGSVWNGDPKSVSPTEDHASVDSSAAPSAAPHPFPCPFSSGSLPSPKRIEEEILDPWIGAMEREEAVTLEAVHRLRTHAQISHLTSLPYISFTTNEASAFTISQPAALAAKVNDALRKYLTLNPCGLAREDSFLFVASRWFLFSGGARKQTNDLVDVMELVVAERAALPSIEE